MNKKMKLDKFILKYKKTKPICLDDLALNYKPESEDDALYNYNPYIVSDIQLYNPLYEKFFQLNHSNYNSFTLNHEYYINEDRILHTLTETPHQKNMYIKFSPLVDSFRYLAGKLDDVMKITNLPQIDNSTDCHSNLLTPYNISYVDNFFYFLSSMLKSHNNFIHGLEYYGSFLCIQKKFKTLISDELDCLYSRPYFLNSIGKNIEVSSNVNMFYKENPHIYGNVGSRNCREKISIEDLPMDECELDICDLENEVGAVVSEHRPDVSEHGAMVSEPVLVDDPMMEITEPDELSDDEKTEYTNCSSEEKPDYESPDDSSDTSTDMSAEEYKSYAYINNFPIQMICLEKCEGTLYSLFKNHQLQGPDMGLALIMQVIMCLITYQKAFHFTHNDLHSKNVMYKETTKTHIIYKYKGEHYVVPTYGYILHIIDFGRSIYKYAGHTIYSNSFMENGDAYGQYNFGDFYNKNKARIDPNYSFDLCRLACCVQEFLFDPNCDPRKLDNFQGIIHKWCLDDSGKNIMYKSNGEERYPGFDFYKMITLKVHRHIPSAQLKQPCFRGFYVKNIQSMKEKTDHLFFDLDSIPDYTD